MQVVFDSYEPLVDGDTKRTRLHFVTPDPDDSMGGRSDAYIELTDAAINAAANANALWLVCLAELARVVRSTAVSAKLDPIIGQSRTVT